MQSKPLLTLGTSILVLLAASPWASAQRRLTPLPHPVGYPQRPPHSPDKKKNPASPWTPLTNQPNLFDGSANPILMMDGSVLVQDAGFPDWWRLTPDKTGSYINGTWSEVAAMPNNYGPLYHSSAVLPDGRLIVEGGEYLCTVQGCSPAWTTAGAIYDPVANSWTAVNPPEGWGSIGDAQSIVLPDGTYMQANCCSTQQALLNPTNLTWTPTGTGKFDPNDEEGWDLLPNGKVLAVDAYVPIAPFPYIPNGRNFELYDPATGTWSVSGTTPVQLWDSWLTCGEFSQEPTNGPSFELGPGIVRQDGTVFYAGSNSCPGEAGATAVYDSYKNTWKAGPMFPEGNDVSDGPGAVEPSGTVLVMASPGFGYPPSTFFEWDGNKLEAVAGTPNAPYEPSFVGNMLVLPTGQVLLTDFSNDIEIYTPSGKPLKKWEPAITAAPEMVQPGGTYQVFGTLFNGLTQGAFYGDDAQAATNFPLVRITNVASGHVQYSRAHDPNTMAVASKQLNWVWFDVPANQETGLSQIQVVASGIASAPVYVNVE